MRFYEKSKHEINSFDLNPMIAGHNSERKLFQSVLAAESSSVISVLIIQKYGYINKLLLANKAACQYS